MKRDWSKVGVRRTQTAYKVVSSAVKMHIDRGGAMLKRLCISTLMQLRQ